MESLSCTSISDQTVTFLQAHTHTQRDSHMHVTIHKHLHTCTIHMELTLTSDSLHNSVMMVRMATARRTTMARTTLTAIRAGGSQYTLDNSVQNCSVGFNVKHKHESI